MASEDSLDIVHSTGIGGKGADGGGWAGDDNRPSEESSGDKSWSSDEEKEADNEEMILVVEISMLDPSSQWSCCGYGCTPRMDEGGVMR